MTEQILLPVDDAQRIAGILREVDGNRAATHYADLLDEHAESHSFEDHYTDIGPIEEVIETAQERAQN